ncbi:transcriptional regulator, AraC family [Tistlia consotensis]|uniref:Transcriptional regulator, AraC family n=1 Tax=Tistlia consotensis USBA 355 TaxID=560819 RepID=A0A1Y6BME5_9PROT|nr:helix-turn-helix transcriptional regulator [Tistlia consotensis]SMF17098.1 transcriptional regulator, AraC family [Tistlia consotensis USBA 355]SNR40721.1 transcriptional regulator, AraC family [Tistlia consotensis]
MSKISQVDALSPAPVRPWAGSYAAGARTGRHRHERSQLVFAAAGVVTVETARGSWTVPPQRAVWVPGDLDHELVMHGRVELRSLYFLPVLPGVPAEPAVLSVTPLARELILRLMELPVDAAGTTLPDRTWTRLIAALLDELKGLDVAALHLPLPSDRRARRVAEALLAAPDDGRRLEDWARFAGAAPRTLLRAFKRETGLGFAAWRQQARFLAALPRLAAGDPVTAVALDLGYDSPSAFVAAFRRAFGTTPGRYFAAGLPG